MKDKERWTELCQQASVEQKPAQNARVSQRDQSLAHEKVARIRNLQSLAKVPDTTEP
jgi:hypothetical protein